MTNLYKLIQYKQTNYKNYTIKLSTFVLTESDNYSIIIYIYDKLLDSYYLRQFNDEAKCVKFLQSKIDTI